MNRHFRKVLSELKTRKEVTALGFSRKELKGVAAKVADKLNLADDATEEDVNDAIDDAIESVIPFLQIAQSVSERRLQSYKDSQKPDDDDDDEEKSRQRQEPSAGKGEEKKDRDGSAATDAALLKLLTPLTESIKSLQGEISALKSGNIATSRRAKIEALVKDTGKFGERTLKSFARMAFNSEDEFEDYLEEVKEDLEAENQDRANKGLETLGNPPAPSSHQRDHAEVISDDDIKALAQM